jgi:hypothetical protein
MQLSWPLCGQLSRPEERRAVTCFRRQRQHVFHGDSRWLSSSEVNGATKHARSRWPQSVQPQAFGLRRLRSPTSCHYPQYLIRQTGLIPCQRPPESEFWAEGAGSEVAKNAHMRKEKHEQFFINSGDFTLHCLESSILIVLNRNRRLKRPNTDF